MDIDQQRLRARKVFEDLTRAFAQADEYILPPPRRQPATYQDWLEEMQEANKRAWKDADFDGLADAMDGRR